MKLFMLLLGCKPPGRNTEQHDTWFGIGTSCGSLVPHLKKNWPEAGDGLHVDAWREVTCVDDYEIGIMGRDNAENRDQNRLKLFFINLGGYKKDEFEEFHYKVLVVGRSKSEAIQRAKGTAFYRHTGFGGARSHIDDKYGVDVDDVYDVEDILSSEFKEKYRLNIQPASPHRKDEYHIGYFKLHKS